MSLPWKKRVSLKKMTECCYGKTKAQAVCRAIAKDLAKELRDDIDLREIHCSMGLFGKNGGGDFDKLLNELFLWGDLNRIWFDTKF